MLAGVTLQEIRYRALVEFKVVFRPQQFFSPVHRVYRLPTEIHIPNRFGWIVAHRIPLLRRPRLPGRRKKVKFSAAVQAHFFAYHRQKNAAPGRSISNTAKTRLFFTARTHDLNALKHEGLSIIDDDLIDRRSREASAGIIFMRHGRLTPFTGF